MLARASSSCQYLFNNLLTEFKAVKYIIIIKHELEARANMMY